MIGTGVRTPAAVPRWVPYHDHTDHNVFDFWFRHTMTHYYDAANRWKPYRVCNTCANNISGYSDFYSATWYGLTAVVENTGWHFRIVEIFFDEADAAELNTADEQHSLMCHEDGHSGGLDHRAVTTSCMYNGPSWPVDFDQHDTDTLYGIYGHSD